MTDIKAADINMFKALKETMLKEVKYDYSDSSSRENQ